MKRFFDRGNDYCLHMRRLVETRAHILNEEERDKNQSNVARDEEVIVEAGDGR